MKLQATTADDGLTLVITFTGPELAQSFARAFDDYRLRELIAKVICEETGPLAAEIRKHVTVAIESAGIVAQAREVVRNGLAKGLHEVETRLQEAGAKAAEGAYGRFLGGVFGKLRKALELEAGMQETAQTISRDEAIKRLISHGVDAEVARRAFDSEVGQ